MITQRIRDLVAQMTLEEKAVFCSGRDFWHLQALERLGIPEVMVSDGPHGLRTQDQAQDHLGVNDSIKAVCFPAGCATASSFDRDLIRRQGEAIAREAQAVGVSVVLGPAMNIKRSPLCGRNFEYISEDPYVAGEMAAAEIEGIQSLNVGTSPKHFALNSQEFHRMTASSNADERTMREIYLTAFEKAVKQAHPWTIMNSYNRINGTFACEDRQLLTDILRDEWGFDGYVVTDWGAMNERVPALKAGCDLEMPGPGGLTQDIVDAVKSGELDEAVLDESVARILDVAFRYLDHHDESAVFEYEKDHEMAAQVAEQCAVLLKNDDALLPLSPSCRVAFIGQYAEKPRFQGGGSSHINCFKTESALDAVKALLPEAPVTYARGFDDARDDTDDALLAEAVKAASEAEVAVIFAGLPDRYESEGYDRKHLRMPDNQVRLIREVAAANANTVVVLHNGSAIEMPWIGHVKAVLESYLGGQAVGRAQVRLLYGEANPGGRLAETFPMRLEDTPSYLTFGGENDQVSYSEGVYVGYRYYCTKKLPVLFPFGFGLSYTTFACSNLRLSAERIRESEGLTVTVDVTNTGERAGSEVVQLYIGAPQHAPNGTLRPVRELKGFEKVHLESGETKSVTFSLDSRAFAYWNTQIHDWFTDSAEYSVEICADAQTVLLSAPVFVEGEKTIPVVYDLASSLGQIMQHPAGREMMAAAKNLFGTESDGAADGGAADSGVADGGAADSGAAPADGSGAGGEKSAAQEAISDEMNNAMMFEMPLRSLMGFKPGITKEMLEGLIAKLNS